MKTIFLFVAFIALCGSFTVIKHHKTPQSDVSFEELLAQFPKGTLPFILSRDALLDGSLKSKGSPIGFRESSFFPRLQLNSNLFSRMPSPKGCAFRAFETPNLHILIYSKGDSWLTDYYAAIFTKQGELIKDIEIGFVNYHFVTAATIDENLDLTSRQYRIVRQKDANGYDTDDIMRLDSISTKTVSLVSQGTPKPIVSDKDAKLEGITTN